MILTDIVFASTFNYFRDKLSIYNTKYKEMINQYHKEFQAK
jgi:hypothetical protein